ncbi:hypothetical protein [uncultured Rikenella sp.]|uniref:hypothetical protein n=1 Tax=uncultured Rikenella sp. TaxID=368003 RepID=UPI00263A2894|nr:hypothetical protein [uncultured Rikenella sp.]
MLTSMIRLWIKKLLAPIVREVLEEEQKKNIEAVKVQIHQVLEEVLGESKNMRD